MLKKFLIGTFAIAGLALAMSVSAAYDFGTTTLRVGSKGEAVKAVQTVVGASVDGIFGPMTAAKVKAWQASNGLVADGLFGAMSKAKANAGTTTTTTTTTTPSSTTLSGGAGDSDYSSYSTGVKSSIKEGQEDVKVLGLKIEAIDSDIAVNNVKVQLKTLTGTESKNVSKYIESVDIYMGSKKVGSADVSDFSKNSSSEYSKTISLSNAVIDADEKENFFVVFNADSDIAIANDGKKINVQVLSYRFTDGMGVVATEDVTSSEDVKLDLTDSNDVTLKSSSSNPKNSTITVDSDDTTDDVLALAFKIDNDEDSVSDASVISLPIVLTFTNASGSGTDWADKVVESVMVKIDGDEYEADLTTDNTNGTSGTAEYIADIDGDTVIDAGDVVDVKVYITFAEQEGNYAVSTTVKATVAGSAVDLEDDKDDSITADGSATGPTLTLSTEDITLSKMGWTSAAGKNTANLDFLFTLVAGSEDVVIDADDIDHDFTVASGETITLTLISGDASGTSEYTIADGDTANFEVRYTTATDGKRVKITAIKGITVPEDKQLSPTVYLQ